MSSESRVQGGYDAALGIFRRKPKKHFSGRELPLFDNGQ